MGHTDLFAEANAILRAEFGYHIDPRNGDALRARLEQGGLARFRHAVRLTRMHLDASQVPGDPQSIHSALEAQLWRLMPYKPYTLRLTKYRNSQAESAAKVMRDMDLRARELARLDDGWDVWRD